MKRIDPNSAMPAKLRSVPIAINGYLGDALLDTQWPNTLSKLESLQMSNHVGDIMIPTKMLMTRIQQEILFENFPDIWIFFAITGLDELNLGSIKPYLETYLRLCERFPKVVCAYRPVLPRQNDNMKTILPVIDAVSRGNKLLTITGYKDIAFVNAPQYVPNEFFETVAQNCAEKGVILKHKCFQVREHLHADVAGRSEGPDFVGIEVAKLLGYKVSYDNNEYLKVDNSYGELTKGDLNFIKYLSNVPTIGCDNYIGSQVLSITGIDNQKLVCTSSWFQWARQIPCSVACNYCFADYHSVIRTRPARFGCNPLDLIDLIGSQAFQ